MLQVKVAKEIWLWVLTYIIKKIYITTSWCIFMEKQTLVRHLRGNIISFVCITILKF